MGSNLRSWLSTVALVAVATVGCDSAEDPVAEDAGAGGVGGGAGGEGGEGGVGGGAGEGGVGGGAGGEGGVGGGAGGEGGVGGGAGGEGGAGGGECGDLPVLDLNADGTAAGEGFTLTGSTGGEDLTSGSCTPAMSPGGSEVAVKFVAPSAALWQFDTAASAEGVDTILYALSDCNDGLSEVACNDDEGGVTSRILVQLAQGDTVFVVVDLFDGIAPTEFVLNATPVQATAPQLDAVEAFVNLDTQAVGLRMTGLDPENDVVGFNLTVFNAAGEDLGGQAFELRPEDLTQENGMFRAQTVIGLGELATETAGVRISMIDDFGLESNLIDQPVEAPSVMLNRGDACEPAQVFGLCPAADACDGEGEDFTCVEATAPTITAASVFVNPAAPFIVDIGGGPWQVGAIGLRIEGTDPENNPAFVNVLFFDAEGNELSVIGDGEGSVGLAVFSAENGTWRADTVVTFAGACAEAAVAVFNECVDGGGAEEQCLADTEASLRTCNNALLARVASARLVPGDATNKTGAAFEVAMVAPTPNAMEGGACGIAETLGICADGQYCYGPNGNANCGLPQIACAEGLPVTNLNDSMSAAGVWTFDGDSSEAANLVGAGSCGGGGPQALHSFTAPAAGTYVAEITAAPAGSDTLIFVRTHCGLADAEFELACNDDIDTQAMNLLSSVTFEAEANQVVTVVVDGYQGSFAGTYTVQVTAQ
jgi:hypothetical protein